MKFTDLAKYLESLEKESSRIEITKILADLFKKADTSEIDQIVNLTLGRLAPSYKPIIFNVAERMMIVAIAKAYKKEPSEVTTAYKKHGDLGLVAFNLSPKNSSNLSVSKVFTTLVDIAQYQGQGSVDKKISSIAQLLSSLDPLSAKFVSRIPVAKLRLGFSDKTIIDALSWMKTGDKSLSGQIKESYHHSPDIAALAKSIKERGHQKASSETSISIGIPILPMLASRLKSPADMIKKMNNVAVEPKLDGLRTQIHLQKGTTPLAFTRNLNEISHMFPELAKLQTQIKADSLILDAEAIGLDESTKKLANFQSTMTRRRKHKIEDVSKGISIKFYVFDILYKNGKSLVGEDYLARRKVLNSTIKNSPLVELVEFTTTKDPKTISKLNDKYQSQGFEGIIVKRTNSKYVPGRTGWRWVKMKEAETAHAKLADTIDAVVMGYSAGKGKRALFGIGQFLAGVRDGESIKTITKVGTGLTDEQFRELKKRLTKLEIEDKPKQYKVHKNLEPDHWVRPSLVVELAADEITKSPTHTASLALRFPRLIKFRDDKSVPQSTSLSEFKKLFKQQ